MRRRQAELEQYETDLEWVMGLKEQTSVERKILEAREDLFQYERELKTPRMTPLQRLREDVARYQEELEWAIDPWKRSFWEEKLAEARTDLARYGWDLEPIQEGETRRILEEREDYSEIPAGDPEKDDTLLEEFEIHRSFGAKAKNYWVYDPASGKYFSFVEGTKIRDPKVFAGKGGVRSLLPEVAEGLSKQIGGKPSEWQHCKGFGTIDRAGEEWEVEVHWFQESSVGKHKFVVKAWLDR